MGLNRTFTNIVPSIDVCETDKVSAEMPGLERKDVEISIEDDTLTIRGEKKVEEERKDKKAQRAELLRFLSRAAVASWR
jgi:HSP20 family protein